MIGTCNMHSAIVAIILCLCVQLGSSFPKLESAIVQRSGQYGNQPSAAEVKQILGPQLAPGAEIILPSESALFENFTERWSLYEPPKASIVVNVAVEEDVVKTVQYARKYHIPFLTRNRGHGTPISLNSFDGLILNIAALNSVDIDTQNNVATFGGGVYNFNVTQALFDAGKQSAHASCSCVGFLGAGMGGGHGRFQGLYGLVLDNIISVRVVLANGTLTETSETVNPELFWALRGAGHNFGIVTSFKYKTYDLIDNGDWWFADYVYPNASLEALAELLNNIRPIQPATMSFALEYQWLNTSVNELAVVFSINAAGEISNSSFWTDMFDALNPLESDIGTAKWNLISEVSFTGLESALCETGFFRNQYTASLETFNTDSVRDIWNLWVEMGTVLPTARASQMVFEIYPTQGVKAVPSTSTAYPHRSENIIALFDGVYSDGSLTSQIGSYGEQTRDLLQEHSGFTQLNVYLNYAQGDEPIEAVYGYEDWRIAKLKAIKKKYDPDQVFSWYEPIPI